MEVITDCWGKVGTGELLFGQHIMNEGTLRVYVYHGLDVGSELGKRFYRHNEAGYAGHCLLAFHGVRKFNFYASEYSEENGETVWHEPVISTYNDEAQIGASTFWIGGSLCGFLSFVEMEIEAKTFEIQILDEGVLSRRRV